MQKSTAMLNLYNQQLKKVRKALESMHEEEQYDYLKEVEKLEKGV